MSTGHDLPRVTTRPRLVPVGPSGEDTSSQGETGAEPGSTDFAHPNTSTDSVPSNDDTTLVHTLVTRARGGDTTAWARLYQDHFDRLYRSMYAMVGDRALAEDVVQETFARALVSLTRYDGRARFSTWLHAIAQNVVRKFWRKQGRKERSHDRLAVQIESVRDRTSGSDVEGEHLTRRRAHVLETIVADLPEHLREAFVAVDVLALPAAEAAARLGITEGNLRVRATRARARIRETLVELGWLPATPEGSR
jgi:RNA polymerase sigma-70 factor (ECF subfamily)